ncbi:hypothetical protein [Candidatus Laterigemmans baculatus]|uniref:hypothetical protein n=2 Tax=Candidatus Laterigemmans baculatus TaxID=2770505 RepID=UPI0013DCFC12|nr:hypothetical protein [Candidatus Laterigemmans baculatus]
MLGTMRRFSIRSLLIATAVVAICAAMPVRRAILQRQGREWVAAQRGHVILKHNYGRESEWYDAGSALKVPQFAIDLLGIDAFNPVTELIFDCDQLTELKPLTDLRSLQSIVVNIEMADGIDFTPLADLPHLRKVHFTEWSFVTKEQLDALRELLPDVEIVSDSHPEAVRH